MENERDLDNAVQWYSRFDVPAWFSMGTQLSARRMEPADTGSICGDRGWVDRNKNLSAFSAESKWPMGRSNLSIRSKLSFVRQICQAIRGCRDAAHPSVPDLRL
jgi:hypothetical protein